MLLAQAYLTRQQLSAVARDDRQSRTFRSQPRPVAVIAPVPPHMRTELAQCGWRGENDETSAALGIRPREAGRARRAVEGGFGRE
jgi:hypothetical protein